MGINTFNGYKSQYLCFKGRVDSISPASGAQFALLLADNPTGNFTKIVQRISIKVINF
jgi:membrane fusion protein (multidrug efflux system)